jgi:hypothetical protein
MSATYTVTAEQAARVAGGVDGVIASLPVSLTHAASAGQLVAVDGAPGWAGRAQAALSAGAQAVIVVSPAAETARIKDADQVLLDWPFASNPALKGAAEAMQPLLGELALVESHVILPSGQDTDKALLDQLTALNRLLDGSLAEAAPLRRLHSQAPGYRLAGRLPGRAPVTVSATVTNALPPRMEFRLLTTDGGLTVSVPAPETAVPAEIHLTTAAGEQLLPTLYESSHRATWRRAIRTAAGEAASSDLEEFSRTAALLN